MWLLYTANVINSVVLCCCAYSYLISLYPLLVFLFQCFSIPEGAGEINMTFLQGSIKYFWFLSPSQNIAAPQHAEPICMCRKGLGQWEAQSEWLRSTEAPGVLLPWGRNFPLVHFLCCFIRCLSLPTKNRKKKCQELWIKAAYLLDGHWDKCQIYMQIRAGGGLVKQYLTLPAHFTLNLNPSFRQVPSSSNPSRTCSERF